MTYDSDKMLEWFAASLNLSQEIGARRPYTVFAHQVFPGLSVGLGKHDEHVRCPLPPTALIPMHLMERFSVEPHDVPSRGLLRAWEPHLLLAEHPIRAVVETHVETRERDDKIVYHYRLEKPVPVAPWLDLAIAWVGHEIVNLYTPVLAVVRFQLMIWEAYEP